MRKNISLLSFVCLPLLACGGSDSNSKSVKVVDAKTFLDGSGGGSAACLAQATYANLGSGGRAVDHPGPNFGSDSHVHYQQYVSRLNPTDIFDMILQADGSGGAWAGSAIGPVVADLSALPGNLLLPELDLFPMAKIGSDGSLDPNYYANESYVAFSGTVNYTAAGGSGGTQLTGSLTNVVFQHVHISGTSFTDPGDMCTATVASASFSATLGSGMAAFQDGQTGSFEIKPPAGLGGPHLASRHF